jgi:hypothetical protein
MRIASYFLTIPRLYFRVWTRRVLEELPDQFAEEETSDIMDDHYQQSRLLATLKQSYADKRNTLTWALLIWAVTGTAFALFLPFEATMIRSVGVAVGWSAIHLIRRM